MLPKSKGVAGAPVTWSRAPRSDSGTEKSSPEEAGPEEAGAGPPLWQAEVTVSVIALTWTFKLGGPENYVSHVNFGFLTFWMGTVHSYSM